jgi:hypothetical protein
LIQIIVHFNDFPALFDSKKYSTFYSVIFATRHALSLALPVPVAKLLLHCQMALSTKRVLGPVVKVNHLQFLALTTTIMEYFAKFAIINYFIN